MVLRWGTPWDLTPKNIPWGLRFSVSPVVWTQSSHHRSFGLTLGLGTKIPQAASSLWGSSCLLGCQSPPPAAGRGPSCGQTLTLHIPTLPSWLYLLYCFLSWSSLGLPHNFSLGLSLWEYPWALQFAFFDLRLIRWSLPNAWNLSQKSAPRVWLGGIQS